MRARLLGLAPVARACLEIFIGILTAIGFFDLGQEAYTLAALLLGIGALLDSRPKGQEDVKPRAERPGLNG